MVLRCFAPGDEETLQNKEGKAMANAKPMNMNISRDVKSSRALTKHLIFFFQISFILMLLILWISIDSIRTNKSLWILFFYSFPSEFLIAVVPHEPAIYYFGKFYHPLTVAMITLAGTLITEALNYSMIGYLCGFNVVERIRQNNFTAKLIKLFNTAPFAALLIAGFTPVPFYPFRILVVFAHYPLYKYLLALFLSRAPRFYILAAIGQAVNIPDYLVVILILVIALAPYSPLLKNLVKKKTK
jgi:membrane protein YqaA with SNARE-associated domain